VTATARRDTRANSATRRRVTGGESRASPAATTRTASTRWAGGAVLSRKPLAPARRASNTYSSISKVVRIRIRLRGSRSVSGGLVIFYSSAPQITLKYLRSHDIPFDSTKVDQTPGTPTTRLTATLSS